MIPTYQGQPRQYGHGLGSMFKKAMKRIMPLLNPFVKSGVHTLKKEGLQQGKAAMKDILTGSNVKQVIRKRGASVLKDVGESLLRAVASPKRRIKSKPVKKRPHSKLHHRRVKQARPLDIFD